MKHSLLLIVLSSPVLAQKPERAPEPNAKTQRTPSTQLTSDEIRKSKTWQLTAGLDIFPYTGFSAGAAYFLGSEELLTASYRNGTDVISHLFSEYSSESIEANIFELGYKYYFFRALYAEGSAFFRRMKQSSYRDAGSEEKIELAEFTQDTFGGLVMIGSQWQKPYFTLGFDWIGYGVPMSHSQVKERLFIADAANTVLATDREAFEEKAMAPFAVALRLYLGISF